MTVKTIKRLFTELEKATEKSDKALELWEKDLENETLETAYDESYKVEIDIFKKLVAALVKIGGGQIDEMTARKMIITEREALKTLLDLAA